MSTGTNYPTALDLWANKNAGDDISPIEVNQWRSAIEQLETMAFPMLGLASDGTTVANTTSSLNIYTVPILAGTMGPQGSIQGEMALFVNSMLHNEVLTLQFFYGGTNFWSPPFTNVSGSTMTNFGVPISFRIHNRSSTSAQGLVVEAQLPANINNLLRWNLTGGGLVNSNVTGIAKDSLVNQNFALNVQWTTASVSNSVFGLGIFMRGRKT